MGHEPLGWDGLFDDDQLYLDSSHVYLVTAQALAAQSDVIVEAGCGRGGAAGAWQDLRGPGRRVIGIDIDDAGFENPVIDEFRLIAPDGGWPLDDESADLVVSDFVLEHVADPRRFVDELTRVLRPGGVFLGRTISRFSLLGVAARVVPNRFHTAVLHLLQPDKDDRDTFPTVYRMNTRAALAELLDRDYEWAAASRTGLDHYLAPWPRLARTVLAVERKAPRPLQTALVVCARKRS